MTYGVLMVHHAQIRFNFDQVAKAPLGALPSLHLPFPVHHTSGSVRAGRRGRTLGQPLLWEFGGDSNVLEQDLIAFARVAKSSFRIPQQRPLPVR
jgi:hypothetical protein